MGVVGKRRMIIRIYMFLLEDVFLYVPMYEAMSFNKLEGFICR